MQSMYPEFPPPQFYILLAISVTLLGIAASLSGPKHNLKRTAILLFLFPWMHVTATVVGMAFRADDAWLWAVYVIPHLFALIFCIFGLKRIVGMAKGRAKEDPLS